MPMPMITAIVVTTSFLLSVAVASSATELIAVAIL